MANRPTRPGFQPGKRKETAEPPPCPDWRAPDRGTGSRPRCCRTAGPGPHPEAFSMRRLGTSPSCLSHSQPTTCQGVCLKLIRILKFNFLKSNVNYLHQMFQLFCKACLGPPHPRRDLGGGTDGGGQGSRQPQPCLSLLAPESPLTQGLQDCLLPPLPPRLSRVTPPPRDRPMTFRARGLEIPAPGGEETLRALGRMGPSAKVLALLPGLWVQALALLPSPSGVGDVPFCKQSRSRRVAEAACYSGSPRFREGVVGT